VSTQSKIHAGDATSGSAGKTRPATRETLLLVTGFVKIAAESGPESVLLTIRAARDVAALSGRL
jgi:hypothetical protein